MSKNNHKKTGFTFSHQYTVVGLSQSETAAASNGHTDIECAILCHGPDHEFLGDSTKYLDFNYISHDLRPRLPWQLNKYPSVYIYTFPMQRLKQSS